MRNAAACSIVLAMAMWSPSARAERDAKSPEPYPTAGWFFPQLIPSPEVGFGSEGARFGMRWQVAPVLYSFGVNRRVSPWRFFIVDPIARQSGSIEWSVSPELWTNSPEGALRTSVRAYFPLHHHGEYVSCSIGTSAFVFRGEAHTSYDAGVYIFSGGIGLETSISPSSDVLRGIVALKLRLF